MHSEQTEEHKEEHIEEQVEAYLLGWLDAAQRDAIAAHLDGCAACRQAYQGAEEALSLLPALLARHSPLVMPATLQSQVVAQVLALAQPATTRPDDIVARTGAFVPARPSELPSFPVAASPLPAPHASKRPAPQPILRRPGPRTLRWAFMLATLLLAITALWGIRLNVVLARERALRIEFGELVDQQEIVLEVIDSSQTTRRVLLPPTPNPQGEPGPYGKVFTRADMTHVVAMVGRLSQPPEGSVYNLWLVAEDGIQLAGALHPNHEGFALLIYEASVDGPEFSQALITLQGPDATMPDESPILIWPREG